MNIERAHAIALAIENELEANKIPSKLKEFAASLQNLSDEPSAEHQETVAEEKKALLTILRSVPSNSYSPAWRDIIDNEFDIGHLLGKGLAEDILSSFTGNDLTPVATRDAITEISERVETLHEHVGAMRSAFEWLEIGAEQLNPGQCEVGFMIPRKAIDEKFHSLAEEFEEFDFVIRTFSELVAGEVESPKVRSISSTNFMVFLETHASTAAAIALSVERLIKLYHTLLNIKKLRNELKSNGVPEKDLKGVEQHANSVMEDGIERIVQDLLNEHDGTKDKGRKNEIANKLRISMNRIANRIDRGFNVEVKMEPLPAIPKEEPSNTEFEAMTKAHESIRAATPTLQFIKDEGEPILKLEESSYKKP